MRRTRNNHSFNILDSSNLLIGVLLIVVGVIFLLNFSNLNIKIGASIIFIGVLIIMFFNISEKTLKKTFTGQEIFFIFTCWLFLSLMITYNIDADIFFIIVILGTLAIREFVFGSVPGLLEKRMNVLFYGLLLLFIPIVLQRIINVLGI